MEKQFNRSQVIAELTKSPHGDLKAYLPVGLAAGKQQAEFFAHLVAYNARKGQIRDAKVALPVIALATTKDTDFQENALAHLAALGPREFAKALEFSRSSPSKIMPRRTLRRLTERYLRERESVYTFWNKTAVQHRQTLKTLYSLYHIRPDTEFQNIVLYGRTFNKVKAPMPSGSVFAAIAGLKTMPAELVFAEITRHKLPFLATKAVLGPRAKTESDIALAIINSMTPNELLGNTKTLETWGITSIPALRAAYAEGLKRTATSAKVSTLKAQKAAEALAEAGEDDLAIKLEAVAEKQIEKQLTVEGNWLVLADKSASMSLCIETARQVSAVLTKAVTGRVDLVFFDIAPRAFDVTGKTYDEIKKLTAKVDASGGTSIGCGLYWARTAHKEYDGIAIISDAAENTMPYFAREFQAYEKQFDKTPTCYLYRVDSNGMSSYQDTDLAVSCKQYNVQLDEFKLGSTVDYYSLPNLVQTMRTNRYSLYDEIMATPLLTLDAVLKNTKGTKVLATHAQLELA